MAVTASVRDSATRYTSLDALRGAAAFCVVLWHWQSFWWDHGTLEDWFPDQQPLYAVLWPFYDYGYYAVDLFFVLSGFIFFWLYSDSIATRRMGARTFAVRRFSRLYPLHLLTLLFVAAAQWNYRRLFGQDFMFQNNDLYHFGLQLFLASSWGFAKGHSFNGPIWSVSVEVLLYALFFVICRCRLNRAWFSALLVTVAFLWIQNLNYAIGRGIIGFFVGGIVLQVVAWASRSKGAWRVALAGSCLLLGAGLFNARNRMLIRAIAKLSGPFAATVRDVPFPHIANFQLAVFPALICMLALIERRRPRFADSLTWLGDVSYSSYLWHFPVQLVMATVVYQLGQSNAFFRSTAALGLFFALLVPLSLASYHFFERPLQDVIRERLRSARSRPPEGETPTLTAPARK